MKFQAQDKPIKEILFSHDQFRIPEYQRPYSWGIDEATDFWNDMTDNENGYFLGSFVFNYENEKTSKRIDIIDGQQRSLTITIFLAVIRDICKNLGEEKIATKLQEDYIARSDAFDAKKVYRIIPGDSTKTFFEREIQNGGLAEKYIIQQELTKEEKHILDVYNFFKEKISKEIKGSSLEKAVEQLGFFRDKIMNLSAIRIKIESETDAYTIFETVNARGADLSVSDLVKNLVFKHYDTNLNKLEEAKKIWFELENNINESGSDISKFLRHYRLSKYEYISEKDLFKKIKIRIKDYELFLNEILDQSYYYKIILNPKNFDESDLNLSTSEGKESDPLYIFQAIKGISIIKVKQFAPLFLSIFRNYEKLIKTARPRNLLENIEKFGYAFFGICSKPARAMEKEGSKVACNIEEVCNSGISEKEISQQIQSIYNKYKDFLKKEFPTIEEFEDNFNELTYKKGGLVKYTLVKISNFIEKENTQDDLFDYDKINIEHILPKEPKLWGIEKKDIVGYIDNIGNLTLLGKRMNSSIGNNKLEEKTENEKGFKSSPIKMTQILVEQFRRDGYKWDEQKIIERHSEICRQIYGIQKIS